MKKKTFLAINALVDFSLLFFVASFASLFLIFQLVLIRLTRDIIHHSIWSCVRGSLQTRLLFLGLVLPKRALVRAPDIYIDIFHHRVRVFFFCCFASFIQIQEYFEPYFLMMSLPLSECHFAYVSKSESLLSVLRIAVWLLLLWPNEHRLP